MPIAVGAPQESFADAEQYGRRGRGEGRMIPPHSLLHLSSSLSVSFAVAAGLIIPGPYVIRVPRGTCGEDNKFL